MQNEIEQALGGLLQMTRWQDAFDVATVAILGWVTIRFLRRSGARAALLGLALLGAVYAAATWLNLRLTASLFQAFFAAVVVVMVVVFQDDLRRFFEQLGSWRPGRPARPGQDETISLLVRTVSHLAERRIGALIVLPGSEPVDRHVDGGILLGGRASEPLMFSLFDVHSAGHDGAVVMRGNTVERFAAHLPLSTRRELLGSQGTRHAAALGLSERCDAVCLVVSEERGTIAVAHNGHIGTVDVRDLASRLLHHLGEPTESKRVVPRWRRDTWIDATAAILAATVAWVVFIPDSEPAEVLMSVPIEISNLPDDLVLDSIEPSDVRVTLRGAQHDLDRADLFGVSVKIDGYLSRFGRRTFTIRSDDINHPAGLSVVRIEPEKIRLSMHDVSSTEAPQ
ncbi:MAG: diadenylate cyclase [Myxococcota bacterium]|jgi:diadenylate cyclase